MGQGREEAVRSKNKHGNKPEVRQKQNLIEPDSSVGRERLTPATQPPPPLKLLHHAHARHPEPNDAREVQRPTPVLKDVRHFEAFRGDHPRRDRGEECGDSPAKEMEEEGCSEGTGDDGADGFG